MLIRLPLNFGGGLIIVALAITSFNNDVAIFVEIC